MTRYRSITLAVLLVCAAAARPAASQSLLGSPSSINRMYYHAVDHGMYFYKTASGLRKAVSEGRFVRLMGNQDYALGAVSYPYVQEATLLFVERFAAEYHRACGEKLVITSAVRPASMRLANSVDRSVHPTGIAVDLRRPTRASCRAWLQQALMELEDLGVIEATEEFTPAHFHVAVFPNPYTRYVAHVDNPPSYTARIAEAKKTPSIFSSLSIAQMIRF